MGNEKEFAKALFAAKSIEEMDGYPDDLDGFDAVSLVKAVASIHKRKGEKFSTNPRTDSDRICALLEKFHEAQPKVTGEVYEQAFGAIDMSFDIGVMAGEVWQVKLFYNGGVLIRNHHRVIGINTRCHTVIRIDPAKFRRELEAWSVKLAKKKHGDVYPFFLLHRLEDENIKYRHAKLVMTKQVPESLNTTGQSLVFFGEKCDPESIPSLADSGIKECMEKSRSGFAVVQIYGDLAFIYGTFRATDEWDVLLEEFASCTFEEYDEPYEVRITAGRDYELLADRADELMSISGLSYLKSKGVTGFYLNQLVKAHDTQSYIGKKATDINNIDVRFGPRVNKPYFDKDDYVFAFNESVTFADRSVVLILVPGSFKSPDQIKNLDKYIKAVTFGSMGSPKAIHLVNAELDDCKVEDLVLLDSKEAKKSLAKIVKECEEAAEDEPSYGGHEEEGSGIPGSMDFRIYLVLEFDKCPFPADVESYLLRLTQHHESEVDSFIPVIGASGCYMKGDEFESFYEKFVPVDSQA